MLNKLIVQRFTELHYVVHNLMGFQSFCALFSAAHPKLQLSSDRVAGQMIQLNWWIEEDQVNRRKWMESGGLKRIKKSDEKVLR